MRSKASWLLPLLLLAGCGGRAQAEPPTPLLWKVSDGDNHVYLLGSFHALKPSDYPVAPAVDAAFADAELLAFEISPQEMHSPELPGKMMAAARLPAGQTLQQSLSEKSWSQLRQYTDRYGLPLEQYQRFEPWFISLLISLTEMRQLGYDSQQGLDQQLMARAAEAGKPSIGLETGDQQIAALDSMTPLEQQQALAEALDEASEFRVRIEKLHAAWRRGDEKALYDDMAADFRKEFPQLYRRVNVDRNQAWLPRIRQLLDGRKDEDALVVVGSLHLLGEDGLVAQLKAKGYRVERL